jgi:hypothetical protein
MFRGGYINSEQRRTLIAHPLVHMHQKKKIALEIAAKIASVNGPQQYHTPLATQ